VSARRHSAQRFVQWLDRLLDGSDAAHREMEAFPRLPAEEQCTLLGRRLKRQLVYFSSLPEAPPEWRRLALEPEEVLLREWPTLPVLAKEDLRTRFAPARLRPWLRVPVVESATGGSTGEPTPYCHDAGMLRATRNTERFCHRLLGWRPGMPKICLWGSERDIGKLETAQGRFNAWRHGLHLVPGYRLDERTVQRVLDLLRELRPAAIYGFTSMLEYLARAVLRLGAMPEPGSVAAAWNGGEMLLPEQSKLFEQAFGVPILNLYGGREFGAIAVQSEAGGPLRVLRPLLHLEILRDDGSLASPGERGRIVCTSLVCRGTPFVRYDLGDLGSAEASGVGECGVAALATLEGRRAGLLLLPDGRSLSCLFWNHLFKEFHEVEQFQVVIRGSAGLELNLRGLGLSPGREQNLRRVVREACGELPLSIRWVEAIPRTTQGKLLQVVREP
jgi:phenylacetate-CoA ligase